MHAEILNMHALYIFKNALGITLSICTAYHVHIEINLQKYSLHCSWMLFPVHVYLLGHGRHIVFVLVLVPDWNSYCTDLYMIGKMHRTLERGTHLVRSQTFLAMLPNHGLEGTQEWALLSSLQNEFCKSVARVTNDSLVHTLFARHKHFSNSQLTLSHGIRMTADSADLLLS